MHTIPQLQPGDAILYKPTDWVGWVIAVKTWTRVSHIEVYVGEGNSVASRNGIGVGLYPARLTDMAAVLRPISSLFDIKKSMEYFAKVRGQKYDWKDLLIFGLLIKRGDRERQICSEFATNFYEAGGLRICQKEWKADRVSPSLFLFSPVFELIWRDKGLF